MGFENGLVETDQLGPAISVQAAPMVDALVRQSAGNLNHIQIIDVEELGGLCCCSPLQNKAMGMSRDSCRRAGRRACGVAVVVGGRIGELSAHGRGEKGGRGRRWGQGSLSNRKIVTVQHE